MLRCKWRAAVFLVTLLLLLHSNVTSIGVVGAGDTVCPFSYEEHSLDDIRSGAKRPYLFGGIYNQTQRDCINCNRGGLWSNFCGFTSSEKVPFWDNQLCNSSTVDAVIQRVLQQNNHDLLSMTPCDMWQFLRGRTTWVIGDSMSKDLYKALKCFMVEFTDLKVYHASNNFTAMYFLDSIPGYGEPHCAHLPQKTRLCLIHAIQGDLFIKGNRTKVGVLPLLQEGLAHPTDIFIVNFGLWHGETKQQEYHDNLHTLGNFYANTKSKFPNMFWFETPKQHFDSADGDYKVPWIGVRKGPWQCQPIGGLSMDKDGKLVAETGNAVAQYVMQGSWRNIMAHDILVQKYNMPIIPVYNATATAWQFHRKNSEGQECSHYCHPSMPQLWLWTLKQTFAKYRLKPLKQGQEVAKYKPGCVSVLERDEGQFGGPKPIDLVLKEKQQLLQKQRLQEAQQQQQQQQQSIGFWGWLLGRKPPPAVVAPVPMPTVELMDGVAIFPPGSSSGSSSEVSPPTIASPHSKTLHPWQVLEKVYAGQAQRHGLQQRQTRGSDAGKP